MSVVEVSTEAISAAGSGSARVADAMANVRAGEFLMNAATGCTGSKTSGACNEVGTEATSAIRNGAEQLESFSQALSSTATNYEATETSNAESLGG
jgi:hypothetical protein